MVYNKVITSLEEILHPSRHNTAKGSKVRGMPTAYIFT